MLAHCRRLEPLHAPAAINRRFPPVLPVVDEARARMEASIAPEYFHAAGAAHGTVYFRLLDDAAFFAAGSLVDDVFVLTTSFAVGLTRPLDPEQVIAEGTWTSGTRRTLFAEARLSDDAGAEVARGSGVFLRSRILLASPPGYA